MLLNFHPVVIITGDFLGVIMYVLFIIFGFSA